MLRRAHKPKDILCRRRPSSLLRSQSCHFVWPAAARDAPLVPRPSEPALVAFVAGPAYGWHGIVVGFLLGVWSTGHPPRAADHGRRVVLAVGSGRLEGPSGAPIRFAVHLAVAALFVSLRPCNAHAVLWIPLALVIAWLTNLYNFMDGADGLAGGMTVLGFSAYAIAAAIGADGAFATLNLCVAASAAAFLLFNFPPARIFMGDGGSVPLGFLAGALGLSGWHSGLWPLWFPAVVFSPFIVDATVTLLRRARRGEKVWQAHRSHYYQRLVIMGWTHRRLAGAEYLLMTACAACALAALQRPMTVQASIFGALLLAYISIGAAVDRRWHKRAVQ